MSLTFSVVTGSDYESGTLLGYLLETTAIQVRTIHVDTMQVRPSAPAKQPPTPRWFRDPGTFRRHLGLARVMPRHYLFQVLKRTLGLSEIQTLAWVERLAPRLLPWAAGSPIPSRPGKRPLLRRLAEVASDYGIEVVHTPSLNSDETVAALTAEEPDVVLGLGTRILSRRLLQVARLGFLNAHSSLLPDYRGGVTEFWQLAQGERETGVSIHWMAPKVDEGPICAQKRWPIPPGADHHRLRRMSFFCRLELWRDVIERLLAGEVPGLAQRPARTPTFRAPTTEQIHDYYCRGIRPRPSPEQTPKQGQESPRDARQPTIPSPVETIQVASSPG